MLTGRPQLMHREHDICRSLGDTLVKLDEARQLFTSSERLSADACAVFLATVAALERQAYGLLTDTDRAGCRH